MIKRTSDDVNKLYCDSCGAFYAIVDDDWVEFAQQQDFVYECDNCFTLKEKDLLLAKIRIAAPVNAATPTSIAPVPTITTTAPVPVKAKDAVAKTAPTLDWKAIEGDLDSTGFKVGLAAKKLKVASDVLKKALVEKYGNTVEFRRGRNGGAFRIKKA